MYVTLLATQRQSPLDRGGQILRGYRTARQLTREPVEQVQASFNLCSKKLKPQRRLRKATDRAVHYSTYHTLPHLIILPLDTRPPAPPQLHPATRVPVQHQQLHRRTSLPAQGHQYH